MKRSIESIALPGGPYSDLKLNTFQDLFHLPADMTSASLEAKLKNHMQKRGESDALADFCSALSADQANLLELLEANEGHLELTKRQAPGPAAFGIGDRNFIKHFIQKSHYFAPTLFSLDPDMASQLSAIFDGPTIPVPLPKDLDLNSYPDQLKQFVVEFYIFESNVTDPAFAQNDKIGIL